MDADDLAYGRELIAAATPGQWYVAEDERVWQLFAEVVTAGGLVGHSLQLIKAPKVSQEYAEYYPSEADSALLIWLRNNASDLLNAAEREVRLREAIQTVLEDASAPDSCNYCIVSNGEEGLDALRAALKGDTDGR